MPTSLTRLDRVVASYLLTDTNVTENYSHEARPNNKYSQLPKNDDTSTEKDTILLVEDNPSLQEFIYSILEPHYNITITGNGVEALEKLATHNPQLILSDVMMPEMDGFTLLERVKASDDFCSIPFILLTARADIQDKLHGLRIGVDDYMTKPFEVEELLLRIRNLIANSKNRIIEIEEINEEEGIVEIVTDKLNDEKPQPVVQDSQTEKQPSTVELEFLKQAEAVVKREIQNRLFTVDDLANELFISKRQLARKLKKTTGLPPGKYLREIKLHEAKRILETTEVYTVTEVCAAIGIENVTHFSKAFEERFGKKIQEYLVL